MSVLRAVLRVPRRIRWLLVIVTVAAAVFTYIPLFPYQPTCFERGDPYTVHGRLDQHFRAEVTGHLVVWDVPFLSVGDKILLRFYGWLDFEDRVKNATSRSARTLIARKEGLPEGSPLLSDGDALDEFSFRYLTCEEVRSVAIVPPGVDEP